jgi:hypothetical protein
MSDRSGSIRALLRDNDSANRIDALVEQHLTQALAHESRRTRRDAPRRGVRAPDHDTGRRTR